MNRTVNSVYYYLELDIFTSAQWCSTVPNATQNTIPNLSTLQDEPIITGVGGSSYKIKWVSDVRFVRDHSIVNQIQGRTGHNYTCRKSTLQNNSPETVTLHIMYQVRRSLVLYTYTN